MTYKHNKTEKLFYCVAIDLGLSDDKPNGGLLNTNENKTT